MIILLHMIKKEIIQAIKCQYYHNNYPRKFALVQMIQEGKMENWVVVISYEETWNQSYEN